MKEKIEKRLRIAEEILRNPGPIPKACYARGEIEALEFVLALIREEEEEESHES